MIIDTHCHLDDDSFTSDLHKVVNDARDIGVEKIIIPGADIKDLPKACKISDDFENVYFAIGVHPNEIKSYDKDVLLDYSKNEKCVAVGECGLDYYRLHEADAQECKIEQRKYFKEQIELAIELELPLIVHSREANMDTYEILSDYLSELKGGVLHCFNACEMFLDLSDKFYYGIGGVLTFKNARKLVEVLPKIPKDRLLIETDAPYLTPTPYRGERNEPRYTSLVADKMAEILSLSPKEIREITTNNARTLFNI